MINPGPIFPGLPRRMTDPLATRTEGIKTGDCVNVIPAFVVGLSPLMDRVTPNVDMHAAQPAGVPGSVDKFVMSPGCIECGREPFGVEREFGVSHPGSIDRIDRKLTG